MNTRKSSSLYDIMICYRWNMSYFDIPREYRDKFETIIDRLVHKYRFERRDEAHRSCYICHGIDDMDKIIDVYNIMSEVMEESTKGFSGKSYDLGMTVVDISTDDVVLTNLGDTKTQRWILHTCCCQCYIKYDWCDTYDQASRETKEKMDELMSQLKLLGFEPIGVGEQGVVIGSNSLTEEMMDMTRHIVLAIASLLKKHVIEMRTKWNIEMNDIKVDMVPWKL